MNAEKAFAVFCFCIAVFPIVWLIGNNLFTKVEYKDFIQLSAIWIDGEEDNTIEAGIGLFAYRMDPKGQSWKIDTKETDGTSLISFIEKKRYEIKCIKLVSKYEALVTNDYYKATVSIPKNGLKKEKVFLNLIDEIRAFNNENLKTIK